ncbi:MAG: alpha/beta hydrolase [Cytophagaceae bacterium]
MRVVSFILLILLSSCYRIEDTVFQSVRTDAYYFDDYDGEVDFRMDEFFDIPQEMIHLFKIESNNNGDRAMIWAVYVGDLDRISRDTVILYCHGNYMHMDYYWPRTKLLANVGGKNKYGILTFDYRGYGMSEGEPTEDGLYADTEAAIQWLKKNGLTDDRFMMYGYSLGTAPATRLSARPASLKPSKLILESPFASADVFVQDAALLALPPSYVTNLKIANAEEIRNVDQPLLWIHGTEDEILDIKTHGEAVYRNHKGSYKQARRVEGAGHFNIQIFLGAMGYSNLVNRFIRE